LPKVPESMAPFNWRLRLFIQSIVCARLTGRWSGASGRYRLL